MISFMALVIGLLLGLLLGAGCIGAIYCNIFAEGVDSIEKKLEVIECGVDVIIDAIGEDKEEL